MWVDRRLIGQFDWVLLVLTLLIPVAGLVVLYSAGFDPDARTLTWNWFPIVLHDTAFGRQVIFLGVGFVGLLLALTLPAQTINRYAYVIYGVCVLLLVSVLLFGQVYHGSRRWFALGPVNLQPSELAKLGLIVGLARYLSRNPAPHGGYGLLGLIIPFSFFFVPMALIIRQPDLGTALSVGAIGFAMVLFMGIRPKSLLIMVTVVIAAVVPIWHWMLKAYQKRRIFALINPDADPLGSGYHIIQSKIAVGSGSLVGKGFMQGTQTQLEFLPEHTTDFVFSVLAEEWGFIGSLFVLGLYFCFIYRMLRVAVKSKELFGTLLTFGIATLVFFHTIVNVGMVVGVLPVVGMPLLLFSYGGSALVSTMFATGLVLSVSMRRLVFGGRL